MNTQPTTWSAVQERAAKPGSAILNDWRATREAERAGKVSNSTTFVSSSDNAAMLQLFGANRAAAGVYVSPETAMRVSAVFACVTKIAGAISTMKIHLYQRQGKDREILDVSPLWFMLNEQPTARYSAASHWESVSSHQLLRGDSFTFIRRNRMGDIRELVPLPWQAVQPRRVLTADSDRLVYDIHDVDTYGADQDDMLHFPGFGFDGLRSMSVISWAARNAAGNAMAMDEYSGRFFAGGAHPSIVLTTEKGMKDGQIKQLQDAFTAKYSGVDNAHRLPLVLTEGLKASNLSLTAEDSQLLDARKFQVIDIARAFGVPPHMIGETSASTSWGSGIESMGRAFVTYTLQQHLVRIEQELNRKLFRTAKYFAEFDRDALLEGDSKGQAEYYRSAVGGPGSGPGWMSPDEVRRRKNMKPLGGIYGQVYDPRTTDPSTPPPQDTP